ncbi:hypothetical protein ACX0MV_04675 [Pseudomonas borbori]
MKKNILGFALALSFSSAVLAADNAGTVLPAIAITPDAAGCSLLTEGVRINTSAGVFGAYACNTVDNIVAIATCHPNGRKGDVSVNCTVGDPAAPAGCVATADTGDAVDAGTATVQGGLAFTANSGGGAVQGTRAANCAIGGNTTAEAASAAGL